MSILDRFLLILLALGGICAGIFAVLLGAGVFGAWTMTPFGDFGAYPHNLISVVVGIVLIIVALRFFFYRLGGSQVDYVVLNGIHGGIRISFETIRQLSNRTGKSIRGVHEFDTRVRNGQTGIALYVRVRVLPDVDLAAMSSDIQTAVKEYIERTTGVNVERIVVNVVELANASVKGSKAWVE